MGARSGGATRKPLNVSRRMRVVRRLTRMLWCASWGGQFGGRRHALDGDYDSVADECQRNRVPAGVCWAPGRCAGRMVLRFSVQRTGRVGVNTLREHATSVQARRNSHHLLPSLPPPLLQQALPLSRSTSDMHRWARARAAPSSTRISAPPIIVGRV